MKKRAPRSKIACAVIPDFPIEVWQRDHPGTAASPLALAETDLEEAEIIGLNRPARQAGLMTGITAAQGHMLCPGLTVRVRDIEREIERSNDIYKKLQSLSPFVEEARPGLFFLDASGFELLYGDDRQLARRLVTTIRTFGDDPYPCRVGVATNKSIACLAADRADSDDFIVVPFGEEKNFLHPLSLERLQTESFQLDDEILDHLRDLGLRTIGQVAAFPANELTRRFGPRGEALARLVRGLDTSFFTPAFPTEPLTETAWFDDPIASTELIVQRFEPLLDNLLVDLKRYSRGCAVIEVTLHLDTRPRQTYPLTVAVERPTLSRPVFLRQLRILLTRDNLPAAINGLTVTIPVSDSLAAEQLLLDDNLRPDFTTAPDLTGLPNVTVPVRHELFLPEQRMTFTPSPVNSTAPPPEQRPVWSHFHAYTSLDVSGLRLYRPARRIEVAVEHNRPVAVRSLAVEAAGPWKLSGQWWSRDYDRRYWEIKTVPGDRFLIYQDRRADRWFLQGVFD